MNETTFALLAFVVVSAIFVWFSDPALGWIAHLALVRRDVLRASRAVVAKKRLSARKYWAKRLGLERAPGGGRTIPEPLVLVKKVEAGE